jgi:hypothetical protein
MIVTSIRETETREEGERGHIFITVYSVHLLQCPISTWYRLRRHKAYISYFSHFFHKKFITIAEEIFNAEDVIIPEDLAITETKISPRK